MKVQNSPSPQPQTSQFSAQQQVAPAVQTPHAWQDSYGVGGLAGASFHSSVSAASAAPALGSTDDFARTYAAASSADKNLLDTIKNAPNARNAFETYKEMRRCEDPSGVSRVDQRTVNDTVMSAASFSGAAAPGFDGYMGAAHAQRLRRALEGMTSEQRAKIQGLCDAAGLDQDGKPIAGANPQAQRQAVLKAVAARSYELTSEDPESARAAMSELSNFSTEIRGYNGQKVNELTGGTNLSQINSMGCGAAQAVAIAAAADPVFAKAYNEGSVAERRQLESNLLAAGEGVPDTTTEESIKGMTYSGYQRVLNNFVSPNTGRIYALDRVEGPDQVRAALRNGIPSLESGYDVPIGTQHHAMSIGGVREINGKLEYRLHDTWASNTQTPNQFGQLGKSVWCPEESLVNGTFMQDCLGYPQNVKMQVSAVYTPTAAPDLPTTYRSLGVAAPAPDVSNTDPLGLGVLNEMVASGGGGHEYGGPTPDFDPAADFHDTDTDDDAEGVDP